MFITIFLMLVYFDLKLINLWHKTECTVTFVRAVYNNLPVPEMWLLQKPEKAHINCFPQKMADVSFFTFSENCFLLNG